MLKAEAAARHVTSTGGANPQLSKNFDEAEKGRTTSKLGAMAGMADMQDMAVMQVWGVWVILHPRGNGGNQSNQKPRQAIYHSFRGLSRYGYFPVFRLVKSACSRFAASSCIADVTPAYTSSVKATELCPSISLTVFTSTPARMASVAKVWRRS